MPASRPGPSLYGISAENSSRSGAELWGKNQFNSTFPLSLCLYMRDRGIRPVAVVHDGSTVTTSDRRWNMGQVIGKASSAPYYHFESEFEPYRELSRNETDHIDIVVEIGGHHARALEVKLTVVPDKGTAALPESEWAPEMVMRPVSSAHAMMGVAVALEREGGDRRRKAVQLLRTAYNGVSAWDNTPEVLSHAGALSEALAGVLTLARPIQSPFLLQPIWRTKGQSLTLKRRCFDVFVWSDVAVMAIPLIEHGKTPDAPMGRWLREIARHVRSLYDILTAGDYDYTGTYKGMPHGGQTDKSFALPGRKTLGYLSHDRLLAPAIKRSVLARLVGEDGANALKPERRFDAAVKAHML